MPGRPSPRTLPPMSLIFATQLTAVATAVLAVGAIVTGVLAYRAFCKQAEEVGILGRQLKEQQEAVTREGAERRRAQAERVFVGALRTPGKQVSTYAMNASGLPIFGVQLWSIGSNDLSDPVDLGVILPGDRTSAPALVFDTEDEAMARTILTFRDTTSRRWVRLPNGALSKQPSSTTRASVLAILREKGQAAPGQEDAPAE